MKIAISKGFPFFQLCSSLEIFNGMVHNNTSSFWTLDKGYSSTDSQVYPRRVLGLKIRDGLTILLKQDEKDQDFVCHGPVQGFQVFLHNPAELPRVLKQSFMVPLKKAFKINVKPNILKTSEDLASYTPERRKCYYNDERQLKFFKVYTQNNCEIECLANFTLEACGCVKFSMPRDKNTEICPQSQMKCYNEAEVEQKRIKRLKISTEREKADCNCLISCTSISYDADIFHADFRFDKYYEAHEGDPNEYSGAIMAVLQISFKETEFVTLKRSEMFGFADFVANCGGLLGKSENTENQIVINFQLSPGLFMGVSIISLIEILYYITLSLACNFKTGRNNKINSASRNPSVENLA